MAKADAQELAALQRADYLECNADPVKFCQRHITIESLAGRPFRLKMWPMQESVLRDMHDERQVIVLKARRLGLSWMALIYALWVAIFMQGSRTLILCKNEDDATHLLDRIRRMLYRISQDPASRHILSGLDGLGRRPKDAVTTLEIGASTIRAMPAKERAARSETAALIILDEFAFAPESAGIWQAIMPTIEGETEDDLDYVDGGGSILAGDGRLIVISTGNRTTGAGAEFYKQWNRAAGGQSGITPRFLPWTDRPGRTQEWKAVQLERLGDEDSFRVEYPEQPEDAFLSPKISLIFPLQGIAAAERAGAEFDKLLATGQMPPPHGGYVASGTDYGDFATVSLPIWPLERGGIYVPPMEYTSSRQDLEEITTGIMAMMAKIPHWWGEARYDASFAQSNRTFVASVQRILGPHNAQQKTGRPNTYPVAFAQYKDLTIRYLRLLLRRVSEGETTRILAISPTNTTLLGQMRRYETDALGKPKKGDDDAVDALIAGGTPTAKSHRAVIDLPESDPDISP